MRIVAVSGISSDAGKTTLACRLLARLPGWEAIKVTKGHYRSCGKDPHACCVSHLLGEKPLVLSGRQATYAPGKDTGRYWDAGASNVHWVVATRAAVADGVRDALGRVDAGNASGAIVEGTGFLRAVAVDRAVLVVPREPRDVKSSAVAALPFVDYLYLSDTPEGDDGPARRFAEMLTGRAGAAAPALPPLLFESDLDRFVAEIVACPAVAHESARG